MSAPTRGVSIDGRYNCYYCARDGKTAFANITIHDRRMCMHVCVEHAAFREKTSVIFGHSDDCPHKGKAG